MTCIVSWHFENKLNWINIFWYSCYRLIYARALLPTKWLFHVIYCNNFSSFRWLFFSSFFFPKATGGKSNIFCVVGHFINRRQRIGLELLSPATITTHHWAASCLLTNADEILDVDKMFNLPFLWSFCDLCCLMKLLIYARKASH